MKLKPTTKKEALKQLKNFHVSSYAEAMIKQVSFSKDKNVELKFITPRDLGFKESPTFREFLDRLKNDTTYDICQPEDGINLRIQYKDQTKGEWIRMAMETIPGSDGDPDVFGVGHDDDGLWLRGLWYNPDDRRDLSDLWAVRLRKGSLPLDSGSSSLDFELRLKKIEEFIEKLKSL